MIAVSSLKVIIMEKKTLRIILVVYCGMKFLLELFAFRTTLPHFLSFK